MLVDIQQFSDVSKGSEQRFRIDGTNVVSGKQGFLGRLVGIITGTRQAENKAIYELFANALNSEFGQVGRDVLSSIKPNDRSRLSAATIKQVLAETQSVREEYERLKIPYNRKTAIGRCMDSNLVGEMKKIGGGKFNEVFRGDYKQPDGAEFTGVFKAEAAKRVGWVARHTGIDENAPHFGCRNIATYILNQMLGLKVIVPAQFGMHQGKLGIVMALVTGASPRTDYRFEVTPNVNKGIYADLVIHKETLKGLPPEQLDAVAKSAGLYKLEFDGDRLIATVRASVDFDYSDSKLLKELNDLQWLDLFCGQGGRTPLNYRITLNSKGEFVSLTGFDNGQSFGKALRDPNGIQRKGDMASQGFRSCSMPDVISARTAEAFLNLDLKAVGDALSGLLTDEEISACQERLEAIQKHIGDDQKVAKIDVLSDWNLFNGKLQNFRDNPNSSYVARDRLNKWLNPIAYEYVKT